jgi:hypothetical protein
MVAVRGQAGLGSSLLSSAVVGLLAIACVSPTQSDADGHTALGELGQLYLDYVDLLNGVDQFFCGCSVASGNYSDLGECVAANGGPVLPPLLADCYAAAYDRSESARAYLECQLAVYLQFTDCLADVGCGGDLASCQLALQTVACPSLPYLANVELATSCLGYELPEPFVCESGDSIAPWLECNFWPDCADGSDEHEACPDAFTCASGDMIPIEWACDGEADCPDGDDEADCPMG